MNRNVIIAVIVVAVIVLIGISLVNMGGTQSPTGLGAAPATVEPATPAPVPSTP
jgi:hypothetical protein